MTDWLAILRKLVRSSTVFVAIILATWVIVHVVAVVAVSAIVLAVVAIALTILRVAVGTVVVAVVVATVSVAVVAIVAGPGLTAEMSVVVSSTGETGAAAAAALFRWAFFRASSLTRYWCI